MAILISIRNSIDWDPLLTKAAKIWKKRTHSRWNFMEIGPRFRTAMPSAQSAIPRIDSECSGWPFEKTFFLPISKCCPAPDKLLDEHRFTLSYTQIPEWFFREAGLWAADERYTETVTVQYYYTICLLVPAFGIWNPITTTSSSCYKDSREISVPQCEFSPFFRNAELGSSSAEVPGHARRTLLTDTGC